MTQFSASVWFFAARPRTLPAALSPVIMGSALALGNDAFHALSALAALMGAVCIQVAANYANDYYDYVKGADTADRQGPTRATQAGLATPLQMRRAAFVALYIAALPGVYLIHRGGWPILLVGLLSMLFAILYTGGPLPLGYIGVADFFVLAFFGPIAVGGTYYVQAQHLPLLPVLLGFSPGFLAMAILTVNNLRDINEDKKVGKKTLAVRFGATFARFEYLTCALLGLVAVPLVAVCLEVSPPQILLASIALIPMTRCVRTVFTSNDGPELNTCLGDTGKVLLTYSLLLSFLYIRASCPMCFYG